MIGTDIDRLTATTRLRATWQRTDRIFAILAGDAWLDQPIALRHPFIFYLGHLPAFAWNHVCVGLLERPSFNPVFDQLFSRGIDPDVDDPAHCHDHPDVPDRWPSVPEVLAYRDRVRVAIVDAIDPVSARAETHVMARNARVFSMVVEHEEMHQETLLYMLERLDMARKVRPAWLPSYALGRGRPGGRIQVPAGIARLGAAMEDVGFGWDNEFSVLETSVPAFSIGATPVTNAQFRAFVDAHGYRRPELWRPDDWQWREESDIQHPAVWERQGGGWVYRTVFDLLPLETVGDWPVYTSLAEARAFARWREARLPTEAEFHRAAFGDAGAAEPRFPWGGEASAKHGNFDFRQWAPMPVGSHPAGASAWGVQDLVGDGWEWTDSVFEGLPGFGAYIPGYAGYSADFFDGKHYVLKGASWATAVDLVRPSFRNWFQAHYPYVFAKFRCVGPPSPSG